MVLNRGAWVTRADDFVRERFVDYPKMPLRNRADLVNFGQVLENPCDVREKKCLHFLSKLQNFRIVYIDARRMDV